MRTLLTGATGFVGAHLYHALVGAGLDTRCATRRPRAAARAHPDREWVAFDVSDPSTLEPALAGCDSAFYLIHGMSQGGDYPQREAEGAESFARAAARTGIQRIIYLGGVLPSVGRVSRHLQSRQRTGEILRSGSVRTIELRAAMILGAGSASWTMVRDLAARLPAMLLPRWLLNHSHPVAIDDVLVALMAALSLPGEGSAVFELPGPERITHRDVLRRVAAVLGRRTPMLNVPVLTPRLSSYWIALVTRVDLDLAKELVEGVRHDLDPREPALWDAIGHEPMHLEEATRLALEAEDSESFPSPVAIARATEIGLRFEKALA